MELIRWQDAAFARCNLQRHKDVPALPNWKISTGLSARAHEHDAGNNGRVCADVTSGIVMGLILPVTSRLPGEGRDPGIIRIWHIPRLLCNV